MAAKMAYDEKKILEMLREDSISKRRAFEAIVNNFSEKLYWQIRHMVLSHDDANDILQNTFIKAWLNIDSFMGYSKISTWLYRIAVNETLTFLNRQQKTISIDIESDETDIKNTLESDPYFDGDETEIMLQKAIATLPDKQRLVFNMKYFNEMTYEEISEALGTSVGALKASYHIAVKKIKSFFDNSD